MSSVRGMTIFCRPCRAQGVGKQILLMRVLRSVCVCVRVVYSFLLTVSWTNDGQINFPETRHEQYARYYYFCLPCRAQSAVQINFPKLVISRACRMTIFPDRVEHATQKMSVSLTPVIRNVCLMTCLMATPRTLRKPWVVCETRRQLCVQHDYAC